MRLFPGWSNSGPTQVGTTMSSVAERVAALGGCFPASRLLCLLIACALGGIKVVQALRDVAIILIPMVLVLLFVILFPDVILALPRWVMPKFVN